MSVNKEKDELFLKLTHAQGVALVNLFTVLNVPSELWHDLSNLYVRCFQKALEEITKNGKATEN